MITQLLAIMKLGNTLRSRKDCFSNTVPSTRMVSLSLYPKFSLFLLYFLKTNPNFYHLMY